eukprot:360958-Chlamydomonas_euryale.AAC.13
MLASISVQLDFCSVSPSAWCSLPQRVTAVSSQPACMGLPTAVRLRPSPEARVLGSERCEARPLV